MISSWQGPQWVLAMILLYSVVSPPIIRWGLLRNGVKVVNGRDFAVKRIGDLLEKLCLVAILVWGGFF